MGGGSPPATASLVSHPSSVSKILQQRAPSNLHYSRWSPRERDFPQFAGLLLQEPQMLGASEEFSRTRTAISGSAQGARRRPASDGLIELPPSAPENGVHVLDCCQDPTGMSRISYPVEVIEKEIPPLVASEKAEISLSFIDASGRRP